MDKKIKLYMGLPSMGERNEAQVYALRAIEKKYADKIEFVYPELYARRIFHDFARNAIVDEFLETDCDILWFLDADVAPPTNILDLIVEHGEKWMVAGATYPVFMNSGKDNLPAVIFTAYQKHNGRLSLTDVPKSGRGYIDGLATGCIFMKRGIFEFLEKPYFEFKYEKESRKMIEGEDLGFCRKVNELGFQFYTDYSMVCKHYKTVDLLDVNNYAIEFANNQILAYDASIRPQVEELVSRLSGSKVPQPLNTSKLIIPGR